MTLERVHFYTVLAPSRPVALGRAYRARAERDSGRAIAGDEVLLRVVEPEDIAEPGVANRLAANIERACTIENETVLSPLDGGVEQGRIWWVTPVEEGRTLGSLLESVPSLPDPLVESIASQVGTALDAIHQAGIRGVHLCPDTVLLRDDSSVLVLDAGSGAGVSASWPKAGGIPPSMQCAAPETLVGGEVDQRSDLYSLGALLFRACAGRWHRTATDVVMLRAEPDVPDGAQIVKHKPDRSPFLSVVVQTLLRSDPTQRFQSVSQLWEALAHRRESDWWKGLEHDESETRSPAPPPPKTEEPVPLPIPQPSHPPSPRWIEDRVRRPRQLAPHLAPAVGRERELKALLDRLASLARHRGRVMLLEGDAGSGKTRLVDSFLEQLGLLTPEQAPILLVGEHRQRGVGRPLQAFSEAVTSWLGESREVTEEDVRILLGAAAGIAPAFTAFLSGLSAPEGVAGLSRESLAAAFGNTLSTLTRHRPVLFVVENLQWADPEGLDLFGYLARRAGRMPILLLGTHRPALEGSQLASLLATVGALEHAERTHLLDPVTSHTVEFVSGLVEPPAEAEALGARIHAEAGASPLFTTETLRLLKAEGYFETGSERRWKARNALARISIPTTYEELYERRLDTVTTNGRAYLAMASVQGVMFDTDVVRLALNWDGPKADRVLHEAEEASLIFGEGPARRFANHGLFLHVGDALEEDQLRAYHGATARAFLAARNPQKWDPTACHGMLCYRVAWHFLSAENAEEGLKHIQPALKHLSETWRIGDAERLANRAVHALSMLPGTEEQRLEMLLQRADYLGLEGRRDEQGRCLDDALLLARSCGDKAREVRILLESARLYFVTHRMKRARETGRETLTLAHATGEKRIETRCQYLLGSVAYHEARYQDARQHMKKALELSRDLFDAATEAEALQALGTISQGVGSYEHAEQLQRMAMRLYREQGDLAHEAETLTSLGNIAAAAGELEPAEEFLQRALGIQRAMANGYAEAQILSHLGMVLQDQGRYAEAREVHRRCLEVSRDMAAEAQEIVANLNLGTVSYLLGDLDAARDLNGDALRSARPARDPRLVGYALTGLGEVARQRAEWDVARDLYRRATKQFRKVDDIHGLASGLLGAGRTELVCGDPGDAEELLTEAVELAGARRASIVTALARALLALIKARTGNEEEAQSWIARAGALVAEQPGADLVRVEIRFLHSLLLRVLGRRTEANRMLLSAEQLLLQVAARLPEMDRRNVLTRLSPHREILAGARVARIDLDAEEVGLENTVEV